MTKMLQTLRSKVYIVAFAALLAALYAPAKDLLSLFNTSMAKANIELTTISFGANTPWDFQKSSTGFVKASASTSLNTPQQIFTRFTLSNPSNKSVTYRKIWLYFEHDHGDREYTTDYTLYDPTTRQRLLGHSIELGPNSEIEVLAAYRFIPSYRNSSPSTVSISWESDSRMRDTSCHYKLSTDALSQFGTVCD